MLRLSHTSRPYRTSLVRRDDRPPRVVEWLEPRTLLAASLLDPTFGGGDGIASVDFRGSDDYAADVAVVVGNKILVAGTAGRRVGDNFTSDFGLTRFNADGTLDTSFGVGGKVTTDFHNLSDTAEAMAVLPDGKIVVVGSAERTAGVAGIERNFAVARYHPDGTLDRSFDGDGKAVLDVADTDSATSVAVLPDGDVVVAGSSYGPTGSDFVAVRYNPDGSRDSSFGRGGVVLTDFGNRAYDRANAVAAQSDGRFLMVGKSYERLAIARYNADGSLDKTFDGDGLRTDDYGDAEELHSVAILPEGDIVATGETYYYDYYDYYSSKRMVVARYNGDGSLDTTFGNNAFVVGPEATDSGQDVLVTEGGKILVADSWHGVARFNLNGTIDTTWDGDDGFFPIEGMSSGRAITLQGGRVVVAGESYSPTGATDFAVARLKSIEPSTDDPDDQVSEALAARLGAVQSGDIDKPTDVDLFKFVSSDDAWVSIDIDIPSGSRLDPLLRLFNAAGREIASSDDAPAPGELAETHESYLRVFLGAGTFFIGVSSSPNGGYDPVNGVPDFPGSTGRYSVTATATGVPADADDQISESGAIALGASKSGGITPDTDVDVLRFTATADQVIAFDVDLPTGPTGIDALLRFFRTDGSPIEPELVRDGAPGESADGREFYAEVRFAEAGTYCVGVSDSGNSAYAPVTGKGDRPAGTGDYTLTLSNVPADPDDQISESKRLTVDGAAATGRVASFGDVDMFSFTAAAGRPIAVDLDGSGVAWSSLLRLFDAAGQQVAGSFGATAPGERSSGDAYLEFIPLKAGTYYVGISSGSNGEYDARNGGSDNRDYGSKGSYSVAVTSLPTDPDDQLSEAPRIRVGTTTTASIDPGTDVDLYKIDVKAFQLLRFDIDRVSGSLDSYLRLMNADGDEYTASHDDNAPGEGTGATTDSYFQYFFTDPGTWYVGVSDQGNSGYDRHSGIYDQSGQTGKYKLTVTDVPPPADGDDQFDEARPLVPKTTVRAAISDRDVDVYTFNLPDGQQARLNVSTDMSLFLRAYSAAGDEINANYGELYIAGTAGTYYVAVSSEGNTGYNPRTGDGDVPAGEGKYELRLVLTTPPPPPPGPRDADDQLSEAPSTPFGTPNAGRIDPAGDVDLFKFEVVAGQEVLFRLEERSVDVYLRAFNSAGDGLFSSDGTSSWTFDNAGTYYVGVSAAENTSYDARTGLGDNSSSSRGEYTLTVQKVPADSDDQISEAVKIGVNSSRAGSLDDFDVDVYSFEVTAGQRVAFDIDLPASNTIGDTLLRLVAADGSSLSDNDDAHAPGEPESGESYLEYLFQTAGTYYIAVSGDANGYYDVNTGRGDRLASGGAYTLRVSSPPTAG